MTGKHEGFPQKWEAVMTSVQAYHQALQADKPFAETHAAHERVKEALQAIGILDWLVKSGDWLVKSGSV